MCAPFCANAPTDLLDQPLLSLFPPSLHLDLSLNPSDTIPPLAIPYKLDLRGSIVTRSFLLLRADMRCARNVGMGLFCGQCRKQGVR